jgi:tripartite-type tricarboxylate transporter receptor subunit TctC
LPITLVASLPNVLIVSPEPRRQQWAELIALLKKDASKRQFASSGAGTSAHLAGELLGDLIGVQLTHIPYKGTPPALIDVSTGQVPFMFDQLTAAKSLADAGKLKIIAATTPKALPLHRIADDDGERRAELSDVELAGRLRAERYAEGRRAAP